MTALTVRDQVYIKFAVNGTPIPVSVGTFHNLSIIEGTNQKLPTIEFTFIDPDNFLHDLTQLVDGSKITVTLHSSNGFDFEPPQEVTFLCMGSKAKISGGSLIFTCNGILDAPKFLGGIPKGSFKGTSNEALSKLAGQTGLSLFTNVQGAQDKMANLPSRETFHDFMRKIVNHGHAGDKSIMSMAVNTKKQFMYMDLSKIVSQSAARRVVSGPPSLMGQGVVPMLGYEILDMAGFGNFMFNYGSKLVQEKMTGQANDIIKSAVSMGSEFLSIAKGVTKAIGGSVRSEYLPHDMGNQFDKYYEAENQNKKGKSSFTNKVEFITNCATGLNLYDNFSFEPILPTNNKLSDLWTGNYLLITKVKFLGNGGQYYEKIRGVSQGYGQNFGGGLTGSGGGSQ